MVQKPLSEHASWEEKWGRIKPITIGNRLRYVGNTGEEKTMPLIRVWACKGVSLYRLFSHSHLGHAFGRCP